MPDVPALLAAALDRHRSGAIDDARALYREILCYEPEQPDALNLLGVIALQSADFDNARTLFQRAAASESQAEYFNNLGIAQRHLGNADAAESCFEEALRLQPAHVDAAVNLASLWRDIGRAAEAYGLLDRCAADSHPAYLYNFATTCIETGEFERARDLFERLLERHPRDHAARFNYAMVLKNIGDLELAAENFSALIGESPKSIEAGWFYSQCRLLQGDTGEGWRYFGSRFAALGIPNRAPDLPSWNPDLPGKSRVLVWAEQGIGDELLFASHLGLLAERCDRLCYECDPRLRPLLERSFPDVLFFDRSAGQARVPTSFDAEYQCAAGDIIRCLNPGLEIEPVAFRPLAIDGKQAGTIELPKDGRLVIGLSYHTGGSNALHRLPPPDFWDVFLEFRDRLVLIDLQSNRARSFTPPQSLRDSGLLQQVDQLDLYNNFDELAALLGELDHVITIDNAIAHLAGTMHCSAILLLSAVHDWRWLRDTERLPWYPATRMIRQPRHGDWDSVQRSLRDTLRGLVTN